MEKVDNKMAWGKAFSGCLLLVASLLLMFSGVSAQVIGGEVITSENISPAWQNVFVYDIENPSNYREVLVSPEDLRYSFVNSKINTDSYEKEVFSRNSVLRSEILDFVNGYMAGPVEMDLDVENNRYYSCEDCDIFSKMEFREVVQMNEPSQKLYISKDKSFGFDLNVYDDCNSYFYHNDSVEKYCEYGCDYRDDFYGEYGENNVKIVTDCFVGERVKSGSRELFSGNDLKNVSFEKDLNFVNGSLFVEFYGTKTEGSFPITDFIPDEYEIYNVSNVGHVYDEDGYYAIEWKNVSEEEFYFSYNVKPKEKLNSCEIGFVSDDNRIVLKDIFSDGLDSFHEINLTEYDFYSDCNFSKDVSVQLVEYVDFEREMGKKIKNKEGIEVGLSGEISHNVSVELREYIPVSFDVIKIGSGGVLERSSSKYNVIVWNVSAKNFDVSYSLMPTVSGDYSFASSLGGEFLDEENITIYDFVPPIRKSRGGGGGYVYKPKNFSRADKNHPVVSEYENLTAALYSKNYNERAAFEVLASDFSGKMYNRSLDLLSSYLFETNLGNDAGNLSFEFSMDEKYLKNGKYKDVEAYGVDSKGKVFRLNGRVVSEEGEMKFVSYDNDYFGEVIIYGVKSKLSLWDKLIQFFWKFFRLN